MRGGGREGGWKEKITSRYARDAFQKALRDRTEDSSKRGWMTQTDSVLFIPSLFLAIVLLLGGTATLVDGILSSLHGKYEFNGGRGESTNRGYYVGRLC